MQYQITGKHIDIGESLQTHVKTNVNEVVEKFAGRPTDANIVFSKSGNEFICETVIHLSTGMTVQARGHSHEIYASFDS
ncbi:ribosome-associated translation inhibitor RaiA, partial [Rhodobacteraceae bacterium]|nr:ribosome-associated translation inhibitor RaiA [Paracoccaceae bacterium]